MYKEKLWTSSSKSVWGIHSFPNYLWVGCKQKTVETSVSFTRSPIPTTLEGASVWTAVSCCAVWISSNSLVSPIQAETESHAASCSCPHVGQAQKKAEPWSLSCLSFNSQRKTWVRVSRLWPIAPAPGSLPKPRWVSTFSSVKQGQGHTPTVSMLQDFHKVQIGSPFLLVLTPIFHVLTWQPICLFWVHKTAP